MASRNWSSPSWQMEVGLNHAPAYEVSGRPYASGGINPVDDQCVVNFPFVTRWVEIINDGSASLKVGFGPHAFDNNDAEVISHLKSFGLTVEEIPVKTKVSLL